MSLENFQGKGKKTNVAKLVSSFATEKLKGMFEALYFGKTSDNKSMQNELCKLANEMNPDDPVSFIRDLECQLPSTATVPSNPIRHAVPVTSDWKGLRLRNVGNTCYLNAAVNAILSVECIRNGLNSMDQNVFTDGKMIREE